MFKKIFVPVVLASSVAFANPYFNYAMCHYYLDYPQKAYPYCVKALEELPQPSVFEDMISMYVRAHDIKDAIYVAKLYKLKYKNLQRPYIDLYTLYTMEKAEDKAKETLEEALSKFPENNFFALNLITTYLHDGEIDKAKVILNKFIAFKNENRKEIFYYIKARIDLAEGNKDKAIENLKKAIDLKPDFIEAVKTLADIYEQERNYNEEKQLYEDILKKDPSNVSVLEMLGELFSKLGLSYKASDIYEKLIKLSPNNKLYQYQYAVTLLQSMRYKEAIAILKPLYKQYPNNKAIGYLYGLALEASHEPNMAILVYKHLISIDDKDPKLYERISSILIDEGKYSEVMPYIDRGLRLNPFSAKLYIFKALVLASQKHYIMAKSFADQSIKLDPHDYRSYFIRAMIEDKLHRIDDEIKDLKVVIRLKPKNAEMLNYLGYTMLLYRKDIKEAMNYIKQANALSPNNPSYIDSLAYGYYLLGDYKQALIYSEKAYSLDKNDSVIIEHLADIKLILGDKKAARKLYLKALEIVNKKGEEEPGQKRRLYQELKHTE